jgi:hypothetical protein
MLIPGNTSRIVQTKLDDSVIPLSQTNPQCTQKYDKKEEAIDNEIAIVWYNKRGLTHVGITINDKKIGFQPCGFKARESRSLKTTIQRIGEGRGRNKNFAITIQYLRVSSLQKQKIEEIGKRGYFPCCTCMHAVARILNSEIGIQIPFPINQLPNTSLIYLKNLQRNGQKNLLEQKTYGKSTYGEIFNDINDRIMMISVFILTSLPTILIMDLVIPPPRYIKASMLCIMCITSFGLLWRIHTTMQQSKQTEPL